MYREHRSVTVLHQWGRSASSALVIVTLLCALISPGVCADPVRVERITISLIRESNIPSRDAGVVASVGVVEGQSVKKGALVAVLENEQQTLNLLAAELSLQAAAMQAEDRLAIESAQAQLKETEARRTASEVALEIAKEQAKSEVAIRVAVAETKLRQLELQRAESARSSFKGSISETELDRLRTAVTKGELETEQAEHDRRVQQLKPRAEQAGLQQIDEQITRYRAQVHQEEQKHQLAKLSQQIQSNEVALTKLKLEQRNIRVPFDGVVVKVDAQVGEWVEPGAPIARVIDLQNLKAEGFLPAHQASQSLVGRAVTISVAAPTRNLNVTGRVTFVSPEVDPVMKQVKFQAQFENADLRLHPGMIGSLTIDR